MNLDINYGRLLLEYSAWGSMHRVEKIARENQKMVIPQSPDIIAVDQNRLEIKLEWLQIRPKEQVFPGGAIYC